MKRYLKEFIRKVHPDILHGRDASLAKKNEMGLAKLNSFVDQMQLLTRRGSALDGGGEQRLKTMITELDLEFYMQPNDADAARKSAQMRKISVQFRIPLGALHSVMGVEVNDRERERGRMMLSKFGNQCIHKLLVESGVQLSDEDAQRLQDGDESEFDDDNGSEASKRYRLQRQRDLEREQLRQENAMLMSMMQEELMNWPKRGGSIDEHRKFLDSSTVVERDAWNMLDARRIYFSHALDDRQRMLAIERLVEALPHLGFDQWSELPILIGPPNDDDEQEEEEEEEKEEEEKENFEESDESRVATQQGLGDDGDQPLSGFVVIPMDFEIDDVLAYLQRELPALREAHCRRRALTEEALDSSMALSDRLQCLAVQVEVTPAKAIEAIRRLFALSPLILRHYCVASLQLKLIDDAGVLVALDAPNATLNIDVDRLVDADFAVLFVELRALATRHPDFLNRQVHVRRMRAINAILKQLPAASRIEFDQSLLGRPRQQFEALGRLMRLVEPLFHQHNLFGGARKPVRILFHDGNYEPPREPHQLPLPYNFDRTLFINNLYSSRVINQSTRR
jgi:Domain of unknown function (DUF4460)